jgi:hypothetical protein
MASFAPPAPMQPPEIRAQQQAPRPNPVFMQGQALQQPGGNLIGQLTQQIQQLEKLIGDMNMTIEQVHKPLAALLVPIAKSGQALKQEVQKIQAREQQQQGGPQQSAQPGGPAGANVPNPAEGSAPPMAA